MKLHVFGSRERIRVLYLSERPGSGDRREYLRELGCIAEAIEHGPRPTRMELHEHPMTSRADLRRVLLWDAYNIIVVAGHGPTFGWFDYVQDERLGRYTAALGELFAANCPPNACILLMGCASSVLAPALAIRELRGVSFDAAVSSAAILAFLGGYFDGRCAGQSHERAYEEGCRSMAFDHLEAVAVTRAFGPDAPGFKHRHNPIINESPDTDPEY